MEGLGQPVPASTTISLDEGESVTDFDEEAFRGRVQAAVDEVGGLPVIARTTYTLGGSGSGVVDDFEELVERVARGSASRGTARCSSPSPSLAGSNWSTK